MLAIARSAFSNVQPSPNLDISYFFAMNRPSTSPLATPSTREDTSPLSMALPDRAGAFSLKDKRVGHYLAMWALSCPLAWRQFNNDVEYVNTATSAHATATCLSGFLPPLYSPLPPCVNRCPT